LVLQQMAALILYFALFICAQVFQCILSFDAVMTILMLDYFEKHHSDHWTCCISILDAWLFGNSNVTDAKQFEKCSSWLGDL